MNRKIEFSPMKVYYWLIILLKGLFFPTCNLFSFSPNQIWSFYEVKKENVTFEQNMSFN